MSSKKGLLQFLSQPALENELRVDEQRSKRRERSNFGGETCQPTIGMYLWLADRAN